MFNSFTKISLSKFGFDLFNNFVLTLHLHKALLFSLSKP